MTFVAVTLCMETIAMYGGDNCERLGQNMNYQCIQILISTCYNGHKCDQPIIHSHMRHIEHYNELNIETNPNTKNNHTYGRMFVSECSHNINIKCNSKTYKTIG
jgi:hypothetical protein